MFNEVMERRTFLQNLTLYVIYNTYMLYIALILAYSSAVSNIQHKRLV